MYVNDGMTYDEINIVIYYFYLFFKYFNSISYILIVLKMLITLTDFDFVQGVIFINVFKILYRKNPMFMLKRYYIL